MKASDNPFPGILIRESANDGSDFSNPAADYRVAFLGEDGLWHVKDSAGTVSDPFSGSGAVATDAIFDAKGDLPVGTGANTAAKLTAGTNGYVLSADSGESTGLKWVAGAGIVPWAIVPIWGMARTVDQNFGGTNRSVYCPVIVPVACTITGIRVRITTSNGNYDVGLYSADGTTKHASSGSTATPGTGIRDLLFSAPYAASPGRYWLAVGFSSATMAISMSQDTTGIGLGRLEAAYPLPTTATVSSGASTLYPAIAGIISGVTP